MVLFHTYMALVYKLETVQALSSHRMRLHVFGSKTSSMTILLPLFPRKRYSSCKKTALFSTNIEFNSSIILFIQIACCLLRMLYTMQKYILLLKMIKYKLLSLAFFKYKLLHLNKIK